MDVNIYPGDLCKMLKNDTGFAYPVYEQNFVHFQKVLVGCIRSHHIFLVICSLTTPGDSYSSYYIMSNNNVCGWLYEPTNAIVKI